MVDQSKIKLLVNASSLKFSGARHIAINVLRELGGRADIGEVHALVPRGRGYSILQGHGVNLHEVPAELQFSAADPCRTFMLRDLHRKLNPDASINLANLPIRGVANQFVLIHFAHFVHMDKDVWSRLSWREKCQINIKIAVFKRNISHAKGYWVQTEAAQSEMKRQYGIEALITENAVDATIESNSPALKVEDGVFRLLTLSHYFSHKNFEIIERVARIVFERRLPIRFLITLPDDTKGPAKKFLNSVAWALEAGIVENRGVVATDDLPGLYYESDVMFLPTLLESFSTTYVEAMKFGVPILTSDRGFARSVCRDAAEYVDPLDEECIIGAIEKLRLSEAHRSALVEAGTRRLSQFPSWSNIVDLMIGDIKRSINEIS